MPQVRYEQAVYGSFPFWERGYDLLAHSPGCRPEWLSDFRAACQRFGQPTHGATGAGALFSLRLPSGPWAVVGVAPQGEDDRGRPGALAFHGLFVTPREFRKVGFDPFALAGALRRDWAPGTSLHSGSSTIKPTPIIDPLGDDGQRCLAALLSGRRVAVESAEPIDDLARPVWSQLPEKSRRRMTVATLAFTNDNHFDLVALPRLAGVALDHSYVDLSFMADDPPPAPPRLRRLRARPLVAALAALVAGIGSAWWARSQLDRAAMTGRASAPASTTVGSPPPDRAAYHDDDVTADERRLVAEGLADLAERSEIAVDDSAREDPTALMALLFERLRYRGPLLSTDDLDRLAGEPNGDRALAWDAHVRRFVPDRPMPDGFASGPLRWQLAALAWSFHVKHDPRRSAAEVPYDLADVLSVDGPIRPSPLAARYPVLAEYAQFLRRLPHR